MPSRWERVLAKYEWAKKHVADYHSAVELFRRENPHSLARDLDPATREYVYRVTSIPEIPEPLKCRLGDAIHNLRSTLDHAAYAVVEAGTIPPNKHTYFPVFDTPKAYRDQVESRVPGLRKHCYEIFNNIQPYQRGFGNWIWELHGLDIINKHRLLIAVTTVNIGRTPTPSEKAAQPAKRAVTPDAQKWFEKLVFGTNPVVKIGLEAGDEIGRFPATKDYENMGFAFDIAISETKVIAGMPTFLMLENFSSGVWRVINDLAFYM